MREQIGHPLFKQISWSFDVMVSLFFLCRDSTSCCQMTSRSVSVLRAISSCISLPYRLWSLGDELATSDALAVSLALAWTYSASSGTQQSRAARGSGAAALPILDKPLIALGAGMAVAAPMVLKPPGRGHVNCPNAEDSGLTRKRGRKHYWQLD